LKAFFYLPHAFYRFRPSHLPWFDRPINRSILVKSAKYKAPHYVSILVFDCKYKHSSVFCVRCVLPLGSETKFQFKLVNHRAKWTE
jgi:hypothetical protein